MLSASVSDRMGEGSPACSVPSLAAAAEASVCRRWCREITPSHPSAGCAAGRGPCGALTPAPARRAARRARDAAGGHWRRDALPTRAGDRDRGGEPGAGVAGRAVLAAAAGVRRYMQCGHVLHQAAARARGVRAAARALLRFAHVHHGLLAHVGWPPAPSPPACMPRSRAEWDARPTPSPVPSPGNTVPAAARLQNQARSWQHAA